MLPVLDAVSRRTKSMTSFEPFRAWRYNPKRVRLQEVLAPPYDVISREEQARLYARSPYNCVRLDFNRGEPSDNETRNRYARSRECFENWRREGILVREDRPSYYLYEQSFPHPFGHGELSQLALLGRLRLEAFDRGTILAHERTLEMPKRDRRRLLEATGANFSPVFGLYDDEGGGLRPLLEDCKSRAPEAEAVDPQMVRHRFWVLREPAALHEIRLALGDKKLYIADGHHRYQTALEYSRDLRRQKGISRDLPLPSDYVLMALVSLQDPGIFLFPTHRMIRPFEGFRPASVLERLAVYFELEKRPPGEVAEGLGLTGKGAGFGGGYQAPAMGFLLGRGECYWMKARDLHEIRRRLPEGKPDVWYQLDVNLLGEWILPHLLGLPPREWESKILYTHSHEEAVGAAGRGEAAAAFLLSPPRLDTLRRMCEAGELMPQKSTYFFPKLASGIVIYQHTEEVSDGS